MLVYYIDLLDFGFGDCLFAVVFDFRGVLLILLLISFVGGLEYWYFVGLMT